jgi:hypothetical protein
VVEPIFFITPLGEEGSEQRIRADGVLKLLGKAVSRLAESGLEVEILRADQISESGRITNQIILAIDKAPVVIADLTGLNPNVMYELAIADALVRPAIIITADLGTLPFDRAGERAIPLSSFHFEATDEFVETLVSSLEKALRDDFVIDNPFVSAGLTASLNMAARSGDPEAATLQQMQRQLDQVVQMLQSSSRPPVPVTGLGWAESQLLEEQIKFALATGRIDEAEALWNRLAAESRFQAGVSRLALMITNTKRDLEQNPRLLEFDDDLNDGRNGPGAPAGD